MKSIVDTYFRKLEKWKSKQWFIQSAFIQWSFLRWNDCLMSKESWMIYSMFTNQQHDSFGSRGLTNWSLTTNKCYCLCSLHSTTAIAWRHIYTCRPRKITVAALLSSSDIFLQGYELLKSAKKLKQSKNTMFTPIDLVLFIFYSIVNKYLWWPIKNNMISGIHVYASAQQYFVAL